MLTKIKNFWNEEDGVTAIEYGLIAGLVVVLIIASLTTIGTNLESLFGIVSTATTNATAAAKTANPT